MTTLTYNGAEKSLADWGFTLGSCSCKHRNLSTSTYTVFLAGASVSDAPIIPFEGLVVIRRRRVKNAGVFGGGFAAFIGVQTAVLATCDGRSEGVNYLFSNAWYFLENTCFMQRIASYNNLTEATDYRYVSELQLFNDLEGTPGAIEPIDSGEQIRRILQFILDTFQEQGMAQPFIIGQIDPAIDFPTYQAREMMCSAVILKCLELSPDLNCVFDYTTAVEGAPVPTIHFLSRGSQTAIAMAIKNGVDHKSLNIKPRYDLLVRSVVINYRTSGSVDGQPYVVFTQDKFGPNGANHAADPERGLRVVSQTIDLQGAVGNSVSGSIETAAVNAANALAATRIAWWKQKLQWLNSALVRSASITINPASVTIKDDAGAAVSLAQFPNELLPKGGAVAPWMEFDQKHVTITAKVTYEQFATAAAAAANSGNGITTHRTQQVTDKEISVRIVVTDGETGNYSMAASQVSGEPIPTGIAQTVYTSLATLQFEGEDVRLQSEISNPAGNGPFITLRNKLNLTGGAAAWTTMNAQVQEISEREGSGETIVTFGPARVISAGDLAAMFQFNTLRRIWYNPRLRENANLGEAGAGVVLGKETPAENSSAGSGTRKEIAVSSVHTI